MELATLLDDLHLWDGGWFQAFPPMAVSPTHAHDPFTNISPPIDEPNRRDLLLKSLITQRSRLPFPKRPRRFAHVEEDLCVLSPSSKFFRKLSDFLLNFAAIVLFVSYRLLCGSASDVSTVFLKRNKLADFRYVQSLKRGQAVRGKHYYACTGSAQACARPAQRFSAA